MYSYTTRDQKATVFRGNLGGYFYTNHDHTEHTGSTWYLGTGRGWFGPGVKPGSELFYKKLEQQLETNRARFIEGYCP